MTSDNLNSTQLKEHYAMCIQLCSTNKINTKNAFGLHVIDYMNQLTKNQKDGNLNFKLVSSTLDVGTKIYSSRVDSVYTQAQKVASNLHHALDEKKDSKNKEGEEEDENDNNEDHQNKKKLKSKVNKKNKTISSKEAITMTQVEFTEEQDQLFLKISSTVDVGATNSYLIETLDIDSNYTYRINSKDPYYKYEKKIKEQTNTDFSDFYDKFSKLNQNENLKICPRLDNFSFNNLNDDFNYGQNSAYAFRNLSTLNDNSQLADDLDINENLDDLYDNNLNGSGDDFNLQNEYSLAHKSMINTDNAKFMLDIINAISDNPSDYCLFDKKITLAWAGHDYWKVNPICRVKVKQLTQNKDSSEKIKKPRKVFGEICYDNYQDEIIANQTEIRLKSNTLKSWMENKTSLLPEDFKRENIDFVTRFEKDPYNLLNKNKENLDLSNFNEPDNDFNDGINDCNNSIDGNSDTEFNFEEFDCGTQETQNAGPLPFTGDNLVDQPQTIPTTNLPYTKFAKKIDVKRLKGAIWDLLQKEEELENTNNCTIRKLNFTETSKTIDSSQMEVDFKDPNLTKHNTSEGQKEIYFSTVYQQLPKKVNPSLAKNLSAPITLVTLLHVVNEKNLKIESHSDLSDFSIITDKV